MDYLVLGNFLLDKFEQKKLKEDKDWEKQPHNNKNYCNNKKISIKRLMP